MTSEIHCDQQRVRKTTGGAGETGKLDGYLLLDVVQRVRRVDGEANKDDMRVGIA